MSYKYCVDDESGGAGRKTKPLGSSVLLKYSSLGVGSCACAVIQHSTRATTSQNRVILIFIVLILCNLIKYKYLFSVAKIRILFVHSKKKGNYIGFDPK
jgi:hypothetical protein